jgi:hypothetical protein
MDSVLTILGVTFAAWCIWLTVRTLNQRQRSRRMIVHTALVSVVVVSYPLSFGPACRLAVEGVTPISPTTTIYQPCLHLAIDRPDPMSGPLWWWVEQCGGDAILLETLILGGTQDHQMVGFPQPRRSDENPGMRGAE